MIHVQCHINLLTITAGQPLFDDRVVLTILPSLISSTLLGMLFSFNAPFILLRIKAVEYCLYFQPVV